MFKIYQRRIATLAPDFLYRRNQLVNETIQVLKTSQQVYAQAHDIVLKHQNKEALTAKDKDFLKFIKGAPIWLDTDAAQYELKWVSKIDKKLQEKINNIPIKDD